MTADTQLWPLVKCSKCGEPKCPHKRNRRNRRNKPVCLDCKGPVVMHVGRPYVKGGSGIRTRYDVTIHLGARTTQTALRQLWDNAIDVRVSKEMHRLRFEDVLWRMQRSFVLTTLLHANSNALVPGGWSWLLRERVILPTGLTETREQLFEAPPASVKYGIDADPGAYPHSH